MRILLLKSFSDNFHKAMSSFVNADLGSDSDSDDVDFDPVKEAGHEGVSEEENSGDEENPGSKKAKKTKKDKNASKRSGGCFQIEEDISEDKSREEEFEKEKKEIKEMADKKKNEEIWSGNYLIFIFRPRVFLDRCLFPHPR